MTCRHSFICATRLLDMSSSMTYTFDVSSKSVYENISMTWQAHRPYNDLPLLPPETDLETKAVLKRCVSARAALAELKQASQAMPDAAMLINTLPVLEARASSEIENIVTTADAIFRYVSNEHAADPAAKEALRYRSALLDGFAKLDRRPLNTRTAEEVCTQIMGRPMGVRRVPGTALVNAVSGEVIYTPPDGETRLRGLLANWERFLHDRPELDPLVRIAAAHYQFEAIHPFTDGNGRTGRILNSLALVELGLLPLPVLYLSKAIIAQRTSTTTDSWRSRRRRPGSLGCCTFSAAWRRLRPGPRTRLLRSVDSLMKRGNSSALDCPRCTATNWWTCCSSSRIAESATWSSVRSWDVRQRLATSSR